MYSTTSSGRRSLYLGAAAVLVIASLVIAGCTAGLGTTNVPGTTITTPTTSVPVSITDDPSDQVLGATLTLNSVVLTNSSGATASILTSPMTFEATHLDAVQEPLFIPAVPQDTYVSVTLTYSSAVVAYVDPATKTVVVANATLANTSQTITFTTPITIGSTKTALLIDFLVAKSVAISGSTVTVTPTFHVTAAPVRAQATKGTDGLLCGVRGKISAIGTNQFTIVNPVGISMVVTVNSNTEYEGANLTAFSGLAVGMFVEVDLTLQTDGTILAVRVEEQYRPVPAADFLVGPVVKVNGSPATSFDMVVRQRVGAATTASPVVKDTIAIDGNTKFLLPGRWRKFVISGVPFTPTFDASTIFAGQAVAVATTAAVANNSATAASVALAPQTIGGTVTSVTAASCVTCWAQYKVTLASGSWLATITGKTTVTVYAPPAMQVIASTAATANTQARFHGFLFMNNGELVMVALVEGPPPGVPISQQ